MAVIQDTIPSFELFQPTDVGGVTDLLAEHGSDAWLLAGGLDSFDWFKDRIIRPKVVIDLNSVDELRGIRATDSGLEIGAMTTLTEIVRSSEVRDGYSLLSDAARVVATPQIRNQGTIGGNLTQDTRCWYYRSGWPCYRADGNICYADTPTSMNREHAIFGQDRCVAVNPSDTASAMIALGAEIMIVGPRGERVVSAEDYYIGPSIDITRMTVLQPNELTASIRIPNTYKGAEFYYEKVRDRQSWDFPLIGIAAAFKVSGETIDSARVAVNGVAPYPMRLTRVEQMLQGQTKNEETGHRAGELAIQGAKPLQHNAYKIPLMRNVVRRAVRGREA